MVHALTRIWRNKAGSIAVEFAMTASIMLLILGGGVELGYYVLLHQKMDRTAAAMGDLFAQSESLTATDITNIFSAAAPIASPFDFAQRGRVIVSMINTPSGNQPKVTWQRLGGGNHTATSQIGSVNGNATLPQGLVVQTGEGLIVAEVFFRYEPIIFDLFIPSKTFVHRSYYRPRLVSMIPIN